MIKIGYAKPVNYAAGSRWGVYPSGNTHLALDYPCPVGTRVQSGEAGTVTVAGWSTTGFGWHVRVRYNDGNTAIYGHLSKITVSVGQRVAKRQQIGLSGSSGNSTGPHVHWEIRKYSYVPSSSWNFTSLIEPYYGTTASTSTYFNRNNLKMGKSNSDVKRFQQWLWSKQPSAYKTWFKANEYDFDKNGFTNYYGKSTGKMVADTYKRLNQQYPNGGWNTGVKNGVWPTEPGPAFFKHFGATSN